AMPPPARCPPQPVRRILCVPDPGPRRRGQPGAAGSCDQCTRTRRMCGALRLTSGPLLFSGWGCLAVQLRSPPFAQHMLRGTFVKRHQGDGHYPKVVMNDKKKRVLRSHAWFGNPDSIDSMRGSWMHRSWMKNQGYPDDLFDGRPVIGICNTWSELTPCNAHFRELAEFVKRGVYEAGGFPLEFPVMSLGETLLRPTAMLFRNLASMDVEESI